VIGNELRIQQLERCLAQARHQVHKDDFRGVGPPAEHAFAEKRRAHGNTVQAADQLLAIPGFDAMGEAAMM